MNERIKELAEQATRQYSPTYYTREWIQGFAELIVKDCRDMFVVDSVSWSLLNEKLEHFGIEE